MKGKIFLNLLSTTVHGQAGSQPESMNSLGKIYLISRGGKKGGGKIAYWSSKRQVERSNLASERKLRQVT